MALQSTKTARRRPHLLLVRKEADTRGIDVETAEHGLHGGVTGQNDLDRWGPSTVRDNLEEPGGGNPHIGKGGAHIDSELGANWFLSTVVTACLLRVTSKRPFLLP